MPYINRNHTAADSTDTWIDYNASECHEILDNFFTFEMRQNPPQPPFYDTPQCLIFSGTCHKKPQIKRRILQYCAKY